MPPWGWGSTESGDDRGGIHRQPALVIAPPETDRAPVRLRQPADRKRMDVEGRADRAEAELPHLRLRSFVPEQVEQQRGDERTVHDKPGIAFHLRHVTAVVVDAVAVEGQRRVTEQQHIVSRPPALPGRMVRRRDGRRRGIPGVGHVAIDDVVEFRDAGGRFVRAADLVAHLDEHQAAGAAGLLRHVLDPGGACERVPDPQRGMEGELAAGPHPARKRHRREKAASLRVPVRPDLGLAVERQEIEPMPQRGQGRAGFRAIRRVVQRRGKRRVGRRGRGVGHRLGAPDPGFQVGGHASLPRSMAASIAAEFASHPAVPCSPIGLTGKCKELG